MKRADFSRTCEGCEKVFEETWSKEKVSYRCGHPGPFEGRIVGIHRFEPWVPAWCPKMKNKEE